MNHPLTDAEARQYSPLALAFLGDSVYDTMMRDYILRSANRSAAQLHTLKIQRVCAAYQAAAADRILPELSEEEETVYKRGRNATGNTVPKHAHAADYHKATGLEALFGFLYLTGAEERLQALFDIICQADAELFNKEC
ncbi:MAG: Mini-ribonuclease 3 [Ruminococcus sp.]